MIKVMFVCHGNICRSPMAEMMMKEYVRREHLSECFEIASAGTSSEEIIRGIGNPIYPPAKKELERHGIPYTAHRAVQLKREDYIAYDLLIGMDRYNLRNMERILGGDAGGKIRLLLSFAGKNADVSDPWYSGRFDEAYADIAEGCRALLNHIRREGLL